ncbi:MULTISPECIES: oligopeptide/dipeptide ABC transporter ATP-binding protein [unclassified Anaerobiospirillum]|uniref:ABC transporter ATP-binding protein n=1 Tax=unclassified Anaerobiospirillum TaxID=2647410 RepID=UPI001FF592C5|nr:MULTISPECIES: oligopeptide/dipeptide ABC transporter ATP-binding protein [unclassified Anaerobiospirillum]MCK0526330.1 ATP-binding cassette domain-containing protein [Anaerobiospirillum sp. NML120449]MCK0535713.1 ATP-binding cassette domain-containing protein [Anaerobiospirillum sp. NML120511]MCK0540839.1 ATP-binding cassette domain-containing protein [Anaerobiospirillum sp. NML02-A-032]
MTDIQDKSVAAENAQAPAQPDNAAAAPGSSDNKEVLLSIKGLCKHFEIKSGFLNSKTSYLKAVDNLTLDIHKGECFGLVGESGCGKTTLGKMIAGLYKPTQGEILYNGVDLGKLTRNQRRKYARDIQMIFQDPYSSLNPRMNVEEIISEPMIVNKTHSGADITKRVEYLLECVGLAKQYKSRYPHEFSGGQRQRIGIARALAVSPRLIVCDEAVSALDVSIQAQILNLLDDLKSEFGLTYLFIAHGLAAVKHISDRIGVMYLGSMVEVAPKEAIYDNPMHPYTKSLISAIPVIDPTNRKERILLKGDLPSPIDPPKGCRFNSRCFVENCRFKEDPQILVERGNHLIACKHVSEGGVVQP